MTTGERAAEGTKVAAGAEPEVDQHRQAQIFGATEQRPQTLVS